MIRHHFFKEADLGARIVREWCKFHFFQKTFSFFHPFEHLHFRAANLWKMRLSLLRGASFRILVPIFAPPWGGVFGRLMNGFALKKQYFLHSFNENHQKPIGFSTILGVWWITCGLTSLWGPRAPSLRPLLGFVGCPSGLGSPLG